MSVQDQEEEQQQSSQDGVAEIDERRAKMERLKAEGIDPYPPVSLWATRTRIAECSPRTIRTSSRRVGIQSSATRWPAG